MIYADSFKTKILLKPREKLEKYSISSLNKAELFAVILGTGSIKENVIDMSYKLVNNSDWMNLPSDLSLKYLQSNLNIPRSKSLQLVASIELARRLNNVDDKGTQIKKATDIVKLFPFLGNRDVEEMWVVGLDNSCFCKSKQLVALGGINTVAAIPAQVLHSAILNRCNGIILVHNHPSGNINPSDSDKDYTKRLKAAADLMGIDLLDHIIIGGNNYYSFNEDYWN